MELSLNQGNNVSINLERVDSNMNIGRKKSIEITVDRPTVEMRVSRSKGPAFEFVQNVIGGANVIRLTLAEYEALTQKDGRAWYAVTTTSDELRQLYIGNTLIAKASDDGGAWGFAYTFPIVFGR